MNDDLDALIETAMADEEAVRPSARFHASVMEAVRRESRPPLPFPWRRFALAGGFAGAAALAAWGLPAGGAVEAPALSMAWMAPLAVLVVLLGQLVESHS